MNTVKVFFFATLKDKAGASTAELELPENATVAVLRQKLLETFPELPNASSAMLVAVNKEYAFDQEIIPPGAEIALFPPVSGGSGFPTIFEVTEDELDLNRLLAAITLPSTGAACFFSGMVRGVTSGGDVHQTQHLVYEAYKPMAEEKMRQVAEEIRARWPHVEGIAIVQRIGKLMPGTPTVLIACSAAHRDTGVFEAARYGIDRLKEIVPIWKKEVGPTGEEWVEGAYVPGPSDKA
jgi:molybdopterin converting factor subunit 1